jgi:acyl-CoA dehydrogenase
MGWDFSNDPEYEKQLAWADQFVAEECEPLDLAFPDQHFDRPTPQIREIVQPLKAQVRARGLWATHLDPELGGQGHGQVKLALLNEILGRSNWAPIIFGTQAPDTGNAEILARFGTEQQKATFLQPLLDGEIFSSYSMTEPQGGSDPTQFVTRAWRDGDDWVIEGEKYFSSNAKSAAFLIVMAVTNPDVSPYEGMSMFLVPTDTPGITILRNIGTMVEPMGAGSHAWIRYDQVRVPASNLLGEEGKAFAVAQARLGGGRIHHAMRTLARCKQAFDMACERALSRRTKGSLLAEKQLVQASIADSWTEMTQLRLLVLYTAWRIDQKLPVRKEIAACKVESARVLHDVVLRAMHLHGALGVSNETPLARLWMFNVPAIGVVDGPTEVHQQTITKEVLREHEPAPGRFPTTWLPPRVDEARARFGAVLEHEVGNL